MVRKRLAAIILTAAFVSVAAAPETYAHDRSRGKRHGFAGRSYFNNGNRYNNGYRGYRVNNGYRYNRAYRGSRFYNGYRSSRFYNGYRYNNGYRYVAPRRVFYDNRFNNGYYGYNDGYRYYDRRFDSGDYRRNRGRRDRGGVGRALLTIGAPAAIAAGVGALVGGGKGALVGALLGGGGGAIYHLARNRRGDRDRYRGYRRYR